jgi:DNA replication and repair protein RecF
VNRLPLKRARDLLGTLRVTVFSPDDLALVKGGPGERRRFLDDVLVALHPRHDQLQRDVDRVLRQRGTLLRQAASTSAGRRGHLEPDVAVTLDVWDAKLASLGEALAAEREALVRTLEPAVSEAYDRVSAVGARVALRYQAPWREAGLAAALAAARADDLRRAATTVGPHRDELSLTIAGLPARTHASQGEQRSLALSLRLGSHATVAAAAGSPPVLLLDDVFSELDSDRAAALLASLPPGQAVLTTTGPLPAPATPDLVVKVRGGRIAA